MQVIIIAPQAQMQLKNCAAIASHLNYCTYLCKSFVAQKNLQYENKIKALILAIKERMNKWSDIKIIYT